MAKMLDFWFCRICQNLQYFGHTKIKIETSHQALTFLYFLLTSKTMLKFTYATESF